MTKHNECKIKHIHIDVTPRCNLFCQYCFFFESSPFISQSKINKKNKQDELNLIKIKEVIKDAEYHGCQLITLSGGEPFLREDIFKIINYTNIPKTILTNGTLLANEQIIAKLKKTDKIFEIRISLDGFLSHDKIRKGSCSKDITNSINRLLKETNIPIGINTVVTRYNLKELKDMYAFISTRKIHQWRIDIPFLRGRYIKANTRLNVKTFTYFKIISQIIKTYLHEKPHFRLEIFNVFKPEMLNYKLNDFVLFNENSHPCDYYLGSFTIKSNGDVGLCPTLPVSFGNIHKQNLCNLINKNKFQQFKKMKITDIKECMDCKYLKLCGTGCRADAIFSTGDIYNKDLKSCVNLKYFEKYILPVLPKQTRTNITKLFH